MSHPELGTRRPSVPPPHPARQKPWRALPTLMLVAVLCGGTAAALAGNRRPHTAGGLLGELQREIGAAALIEPRLSISPDDPRCAAGADSRAGCAPLSVATLPSDRIASIAARAARAIRERADPDALHAAALISLLYESTSDRSLHQAIAAMKTASRLAERPAPILADLAAAYLVRAGRTHALRDLAAAIEAAQEAVEREPGNLAAHFNLALALEALDLPAESAREWGGYLVQDSVSAWAGEARRHLQSLAALPMEAVPPRPDAPVTAYSAYAAAEPQRARELGWCRVLGAWAGAVLSGDVPGAEMHLERAQALATGLERRPGGDASLADGIRSIHEVSRRGGMQLAKAHAEFSAGCMLEGRVDFRAALPRFARAVAAADESPTLRAWAGLLHGASLFHRGDFVGGQTIIRRVVQASDSVRHPALAGRARLLSAVTSIRGEHFSQALEDASRARVLFGHAGERELEGAAMEVMLIAHMRLGDPDGGYALAAGALRNMRPYRRSYRLHNLLGTTASTLGEDGFPRAAIRVQDEGVRVAERIGNPVYVSEARLWRARLRAIAHAHTSARQDVAAARAALASLPDPDPQVRRFLISRQQMAEAPGRLYTDPNWAAAALDSAAEFFLDSIHSPFVAFPAIVDAALAHLATGHTAQATDRLDFALTVLERRRDQVRMEPRRAAAFEEARTLVDHVTLLELAAGRPANALAYLDRGRASLAPAGAPTSDSWSHVVGPRGEVALVYALIADTLIVWTVRGQQVQVAREVVDTVHLVRTIERVQRQMEQRAGETELRRGLAELYELLVRPVQGWLGDAETPLVVIADGDLSAVPFSALYDERRKQFLVQDHPLRSAVSLREARRPAQRHLGMERRVLFVSDPAFDRRMHPGFSRLPQAAAEVAEIARGYPGAQLLGGGLATGPAVRAALNGADLVHYAGHAVFDDERPERSYLLLAASPGDTAQPMLNAGEIARMDLRHLSLVVLSACRTVRTGPGRAAGFSGLAGAFLAAGAAGTVGSLWEVDDRLTRPLMGELHRSYQTVPDAARALRAAQLHLLRSSNANLRSPAVWAAFRYVGA